MRFSIPAALIAIMAPLAFALPSASPSSLEHPDLDLVSSVHNLTERTYYVQPKWTSLRCDKISGYYQVGIFRVRYDFGCLCYNDIDTFCRVNSLSSSVNGWIKGQFNYKSYDDYPTGSQPTCDDNGGYTCPFGKNKDGTCAQHAASCGEGQCLQSDGTCCPRGTTKINGLCCATTCRGTSSGKCYGAGSCTDGKVLSNELCCTKGWTGYDTVCCPDGQVEDDKKPGTCKCKDDNQMINKDGVCAARCTTGNTWYPEASKCCPSFQTLIKGVCSCPAGKVLNSAKTACVDQCNDQQKFVPESGTCAPKCGQNYSWSYSKTNPAGLCCTGGTVCHTKVCCLPTQTESEGHCCPSGHTWRNNACQAPSGVATSTAKARRRSHNQRTLTKSDKTRLRIDEKLCPKNLSACPIDASDKSSYECLDSFTDISSCGGCASLGEGQDCTAIKGAKWMGCEQGSCVVYSCRPGFKLIDGKTCVKA